MRVKMFGAIGAIATVAALAAFKERTDGQLAVRRLVTAEQFQKMQQVRRRAVHARRERPMRRSMAPERAPAGPDAGEDLAEVDPS